jgi:hypothetical protein
LDEGSGPVAVIGLLIGIGAPWWRGPIEPQGGEGVLAGLQVGQPVALRDLGAAYEVRVLGEQLPTGEEVAGIGVDYLVLRAAHDGSTRWGRSLLYLELGRN